MAAKEDDIDVDDHDMDRQRKALSLIVMGVAGSGKTTVGRRLAHTLGCPFLDADDYHSAANISKMASGTPLVDADRWPWLDSVQEAINNALSKNDCVVTACSALKSAYRTKLMSPTCSVRFVYLKVSPEAVLKRVSGRADHFMPAELVRSQFATLEEPTDAITVDGEMGVEEIVSAVLEQV